MTGPLTPSIFIEHRRGLTTCNCCGLDNGSVLCLVFRWTEPTFIPNHSGSTSVALCSECRDLTVAALGPSLTTIEASEQRATKNSELMAERDAYRAMVCDLLASASPNALEHPTMTRQWNRARRLLRNGPRSER